MPALKPVALPVVGEPTLTKELIATFDQPTADETPLKPRLSSTEIEHMGPRDGSGASYLEFHEQLRRLRIEEEEIKTRNAQREMSLKETERMESQKFYTQSHCSHLLGNGEIAVGGQFDAQNVFQGICQSCSKIFVGIGEGKDNLPVQIWGRIRPGVIGGVSLA